MPPMKKRDPAEIIVELQDRVSKIEIEKDVISKIVRDLLEGIRERDRQIEELKVEIAASKKSQLLKIRALLSEIQEVVKNQHSEKTQEPRVDSMDLDFLARKVAKKLEEKGNKKTEKGGPGFVFWLGGMTVLAVIFGMLWYILR